MNEEYLKGLHGHLGIKDDYSTWINTVKDDQEYLTGLHGHLGIKDDYNTWAVAVGFKEPDGEVIQEVETTTDQAPAATPKEEGYFHKYDPAKHQMVSFKGGVERGLDPLPVEEKMKQSIIEKLPAFKKVYGEKGENLDVKFDMEFEPTGFGHMEYFSPEQEQITYTTKETEEVVAHPSPGKHAVLFNPKYVTENSGESITGDMLHGMNTDERFAELKVKFASAAEQAGLKDNAMSWYQKDLAEGKGVDDFETYWSNDVDGRIRQFFQPNSKDHAIFMEESTPEMKHIGKQIVDYMETGEPYTFDYEAYKDTEWVNRAITSPAKMFLEDGSRISVSPMIYSQDGNHFVFPTVRDIGNTLVQLPEEKAVIEAIQRKDAVAFDDLEQAKAFANGLSERTGEIFRGVPEGEQKFVPETDQMQAVMPSAYEYEWDDSDVERESIEAQKEVQKVQKEAQKKKDEMFTENVEKARDALKEKDLELFTPQEQKDRIISDISKDKGTGYAPVSTAISEQETEKLNELGELYAQEEAVKMRLHYDFFAEDRVDEGGEVTEEEVKKLLVDTKIEEEISNFSEEDIKVLELQKQLKDIAQKKDQTYDDIVKRSQIRKEIEEIKGKRLLTDPVSGELSPDYAELVAKKAEEFTEEAMVAGKGRKSMRDRLAEMWVTKAMNYSALQKEMEKESSIRLGGKVGLTGLDRPLGPPLTYSEVAESTGLGPMIHGEKAKDWEGDVLKAAEIKKKLSQARHDLDAMNEAFLLNLDPADVDKGIANWLKIAGTSFVRGLPLISDLAEEDLLGSTGRDVLKAYERIVSEGGFETTPEQRKAFQDEFNEKVAEGVGGFAAIIPELAVYGALLETGAGWIGLTRLLARLAKPLMRGATAVQKMKHKGGKFLSFFLRASMEETKLLMADFPKGAGTGFVAGGDIMKWAGINFTPWAGRIFGPLLNKVTQATAGGTLGLEMAAIMESGVAAATDDKEFMEEIKMRFGDDLTEAQEKIAVDAVVMSMFGGWSAMKEANKLATTATVKDFIKELEKRKDGAAEFMESTYLPWVEKGKNPELLYPFGKDKPPEPPPPGEGKEGEKPIEEKIETKEEIKEEVTPTEEKVEVKEEVEPVEMKSDKELEKRQAEIEEIEGVLRMDTPHKEMQSEFNRIDKELEKREWNSVMQKPLEDVNSELDKLEKKDKEMPYGYGVYIEPRDIKESRSIVDRYSEENKSDLSDREIKQDFKEAMRGNPTTWYADGLKLRESVKEAGKRGITFKELVGEGIKIYTKAGYDKETAERVVAGMLEPIFKKPEAKEPSAEHQELDTQLKERKQEKHKKIGVGKPMMGAVHIHKSAETKLPDQKGLEGAKAKLPEGFEYDVVKYNPKTKTYSFTRSEDFNTAAEPTVGQSYTVTADGTLKKGATPSAKNPQIYHHKHLFVEDSYEGFDVLGSKKRSLEWMDKPHDSKKIGRKEHWDKWTKENLEEKVEIKETVETEVKPGREKRIKTSEVETDVDLFQTREAEFSQETVESIVKDVKEGKFNEGELDPIRIWTDPKDGKTYVLAGHSRLEAYKRLAAEGRKEFEDIPSIKMDYKTKEEAQKFAKERSNILGRKETMLERSNIYREMREKGKNRSELLAEAKKNEGRNAVQVVNLSALNPKGKAADAIKQFENSPDVSTRNKVVAIADWIGDARNRFPKLSNLHENEMFDFLMEAYSSKRSKQADKINSKRDFNAYIDVIVGRAEKTGGIKEDVALNLKDVVGKSPLEIEYDTEMEAASQKVREARKELDDKRADLLSRDASEADTKRIINEHEKRLQKALKEEGELRKLKGQVKEEAKKQTSLFEEIENQKTLSNEAKEKFVESTEKTDKDGAAIEALENKEKGATKTDSREIIEEVDNLIGEKVVKGAEQKVPGEKAWEDFSREEREGMAETSKGGGGKGSVGPLTSRTYRKFISDAVSKAKTILNFGAGRGAKKGEAGKPDIVTKTLKDQGYEVTAYDFPENMKTWDKKTEQEGNDALTKKYDEIIASNVVNVQPTMDALNKTLAQISAVLKENGRAIINYPKGPRKLDRKGKPFTPREMKEALRNYFHDVREVADANGKFNRVEPIFEVRHKEAEGMKPKESLTTIRQAAKNEGRKDWKTASEKELREWWEAEDGGKAVMETKTTAEKEIEKKLQKIENNRAEGFESLADALGFTQKVMGGKRPDAIKALNKILKSYADEGILRGEQLWSTFIKELKRRFPDNKEVVEFANKERKEIEKGIPESPIVKVAKEQKSIVEPGEKISSELKEEQKAERAEDSIQEMEEFVKSLGVPLERWEKMTPEEKGQELAVKRSGDIASMEVDSKAFGKKLKDKHTEAELEALPFIIEKTSVPEVLGRKDLEKIVANPSKELLETASRKGLKSMKEIIEQGSYGDYIDARHRLLMETYGLDIGFVRDYVSHIWDIPKQRKSEVVNWFMTNNLHTKKRTIETLKKGIEELGLKPKTLNLSKILSYYDQTIIKASANVRFVEALSKLVDSEGNKLIQRWDLAPEGWEGIDHPAFQKTKLIGADKRNTPALTLLKSIGKVNAEKLRENGVYTIGELSKKTPEEIAKMLSISKEKGQELLDSVGKVLKENPGLENLKEYPIEKLMLMRLPAKVSPEIKHLLDIILSKPSELWKQPQLNALNALNAFVKKSWLTYSLFHHIALTEPAFVIAGKPVGLKLLSPIRWYKAVFKGDYEWLKNTEGTKDFVKHTGQIGALTDVMREEVNTMIDGMMEQANNFLPKQAHYPVKMIHKGVKKFNDIWDKTLWDYMHNSYKVLAYETLKNEIFDKNGRTITDPALVKRTIAQFVNDTFGGQAWDLLLVDPNFLKMSQLVLLSPDWTLSTARQALSPFASVLGLEKGLFGTRRGKDVVMIDKSGKKISAAQLRGSMGSIFWARAVIYMYGMANTLNYGLTKGKYGGDGRFMWDNDPGEKTYIEICNYPDGTKKYLRWGKQFRELPEWIEKFPYKLASKLSPVLHIATEQITGVSTTGWDKEWKDMAFWDSIDERLLDLVKKPIPFSFQAMMRNQEIEPLSIAFPVHRGLTPSKVKRKFKEGLTSEDPVGIRELIIHATEGGLTAEHYPVGLLDNAIRSMVRDEAYEVKKKYDIPQHKTMDWVFANTKNPDCPKCLEAAKRYYEYKINLSKIRSIALSPEPLKYLYPKKIK